MNICNEKFISIFDTQDRVFTTRNYCENVAPPKKNQITGETLKHVIKFIDWCLIENEVKSEGINYNKCYGNIRKNKKTITK